MGLERNFLEPHFDGEVGLIPAPMGISITARGYFESTGECIVAPG